MFFHWNVLLDIFSINLFKPVLYPESINSFLSKSVHLLFSNFSLNLLYLSISSLINASCFSDM